MRPSRDAFGIVIAVSICILLSGSVRAQPAQIGATLELKGTCAKTSNDLVETCEPILNVLRFADGYDSFQFKLSTGMRKGMIIYFVGSKWGNNTTNGAKGRTGDNAIFMKIQQVVVLEPAAKQQSINNLPGQCVLAFRSEDTRNIADLTGVSCEYQDGKIGTVINLSTITAADLHLIAKNYSTFP